MVNLQPVSHKLIFNFVVAGKNAAENELFLHQLQAEEPMFWTEKKMPNARENFHIIHEHDDPRMRFVERFTLTEILGDCDWIRHAYLKTSDGVIIVLDPSPVKKVDNLTLIYTVLWFFGLPAAMWSSPNSRDTRDQYAEDGLFYSLNVEQKLALGEFPFMLYANNGIFSKRLQQVDLVEEYYPFPLMFEASNTVKRIRLQSTRKLVRAMELFHRDSKKKRDDDILFFAPPMPCEPVHEQGSPGNEKLASKNPVAENSSFRSRGTGNPASCIRPFTRPKSMLPVKMPTVQDVVELLKEMAQDLG